VIVLRHRAWDGLNHNIISRVIFVILLLIYILSFIPFATQISQTSYQKFDFVCRWKILPIFIPICLNERVLDCFEEVAQQKSKMSSDIRPVPCPKMFLVSTPKEIDTADKTAKNQLAVRQTPYFANGSIQYKAAGCFQGRTTVLVF